MASHQEEKRALSLDRLDKADRLLAVAGFLLEQSRWEPAVQRSYDAAPSAGRAILVLVGGAPWTHKGVMTMVNRRLVPGGCLSKEYGRWFRDLF